MSRGAAAEAKWTKPGWQLFAAVLLAVGASSCSGQTGEGDTNEPDAGIPKELGYCDVTEILDVKCRRCHTDPLVHGAPFSLEGFAVMAEEYPEGSGQTRSARMSFMITKDFMPYRDNGNIEPPVEDLTPDEEAKLVEWLDAGAPRGSGKCD